MPCYETPRPEEIAAANARNEARNKRNEELLKLEALLCALTTALGGQHPVWDSIDWQEAGVTPAEFEAWWTVHCKADAERRANLKPAV